MEGGVDGCVEFGGFIAPCGHDEAAVVDEPHEEGGFVFGALGGAMTSRASGFSM